MDPMLARATRLLHSSSKASTDQLRAMLEDAIKQRYGDSKSFAHLTIIKEYVPKKEGSSKHSSSSSRKEDRDTEKKKHEKASVDLTESPKSAEPVKSKHVPTVHEMEPIKDDVEDTIDLDADDDEDDIDDDIEEDDDDDDDDDDLALEILEDDLSCVVCRGMSVGVANQLVECCECHSLYHQECHQPPVASNDVSDPRCAWYCTACTKAINKQPSKSSTSSKSASSAVSHSSSHSSTKPSHRTQSEPGQNLFKRQDSVSKSSSSSSKSQLPSATSVGMAGLAASFLPPVTSSQGTTKNSSSSSSSAKAVPPKVVTNVISADKRLANMKKKAAAKQQEKRKHNK